MALTTAQIHQAADQIDKDGKKATLVAIRTVLNGGSFSTIQEAMKTWKRKIESDFEANPVPAEVMEELEKIASGVWEIAERIASEKHEEDRRTTRAEKAQAESEFSELSRAYDEAEQSIAILKNESERQRREIVQWERVAEEQRHAVQALELEIAKYSVAKELQTEQIAIHLKRNTFLEHHLSRVIPKVNQTPSKVAKKRAE